MKHDSKLKIKAIKLRKRGFSYNEIRKEVNVAKSTLSLWLKNIPLKPEHQKRLYTKQIEILSRGAPSQKARREEEVKKIIEAAEEEIKLPLSKESYRMMGAAVYWAEGSKTRLCQVTNSDPSMILFMVHWFKLVLEIRPAVLKAKLNIYPQQNENKIKKFWSELTGIPLANFGKSYVKPISSGYKKNNLYYGTIRIDVPKSVNIRYRIFGWIKAAIQDIDPRITTVQRKWKSLTETERPVNLKSKNMRL